MKKIALLLLLLLFTIGVKAADNQNTLVVLTKNGIRTAFVLKDKPEVTFRGTDLVITAGEVETTFPLADVLRFEYEQDDVTGIIEHHAETPAVSYDASGTLVVTNVPAGAAVSVYSSDGKLVQQLTPRRTGTYRLPLSGLPKGVYFVRIGTATCKITKQ
jgi:hypothetical protein